MDRSEPELNPRGGMQESLSYTLARFFPFWYKLTPGQQRRLAGYCTVRQVRAGENLDAQASGGGLFFVSVGAVRAYMLSSHGREVTICRRSCGQPGAVSPVSESRPENVVPVLQAEEDSTLVCISGAVLHHAMQEFPDLQEFSRRVTADCAQEVVNAFFSFAFLPLQARLARILLDRLRAEGPQTRAVRVTHEMLASAAGTSREVATRTLGRMQADGIVRTGRSHIEILDMARLEALALGE